MTATATPPPAADAPRPDLPLRRPRRRAGRPSAPLLSAPVARIVTLTALGAYAALRWSTLVAPSGAGRMALLLAIALAAGLAVGQLTRLPALAQAPAAVAVVVVWAAASMIASGAAASLVLEPRNWDDLALGLQQGIEQLPRVLVPYSQPDEWPRISILLGGALLLALGCVLGLSPGRRGVPLRDGTPFGGGIGLRMVAATPLIAAAIVPPVIMEPSAPVLEGIALFVLLAAFLWLERLPRAHVLFAVMLLAIAAGVGAVGLTSLDRKEPWVDAQKLVGALDRPDPARFDWSQSYGPLDWPRTGREIVRIKSRVQTYWKAQNLDGFDGVRWTRTAPLRPTAPEAEVPQQAEHNRAWRVPVQVTLRDFSTSDVIGAGTTTGFEHEPTKFVAGASPGTWVSNEPLEPGDGYVANTIVPRPRQQQLANAGTDYPEQLLRYLLVGLPQPNSPNATNPRRYSPGAGVAFVPPFGSAADGAPQSVVAAQLLVTSPYERSYQLAQQLAAGAATPYEFVQRVLGYLRQGYSYSETPPRRQLPLDAFLFRDRVGYCQQFAGAAALLLRMGGVPTRVAAGFTSGSRDGARDEYVVRDYDAHAWIEVWFPQIGWVKFDPTPTTAPARSGRAPRAAPTRTVQTPLPQQRLPEPPAARVDTPAPTAGSGSSGWSPVAFVALALVVIALLAAGLLWRRSLARPRDADALLGELQRALRRTGRPPEPQLTLLALERRMHDAPDAAGYVRAVRLARFGGEDAGVTPRQRRALRAELARGLGLGGRLRALFALPPRWGR
ncbi:transglutaminase family protein [Conexibacter sp. CPCC 206217]|uniref:transglutaminase-like domain-containing protein n=1 Tax=Conexibacter sp. CPCC 206217 TaxID=3064574 RepID=UPI0027162D74|nr:transglutaminase-like domain-containing protein [Conexibacter sp. CPCC 206217]MDO8210704.1 transglutaminase-like domain-containing protein [Conexibacter sp. CPCC 206217]